LHRAMSDPAIHGTAHSITVASGLSGHNLKNAVAVSVPGVHMCGQEKRAHAIVGYRGFIPGLKAETVFGAEKTHANTIARRIRDPAHPDDGAGQWRGMDEEYTWKTAPDYPQGRKLERETYAWAKTLQAHDPPPSHMTNVGHTLDHMTKDRGHAMQGYSGSRHFRLPRTHSNLAQTHDLGRTFDLNHTKPKDRAVMPFEMHAAAMPGYSGHIRGRAIA